MVMAYVLLAFSIVSEVFGSTMLKLSKGFSRIIPVLLIIAGYALSFYLLGLTLVHLPLGSSYAIWSGVGTFLTAIVGVLLFKEKINRIGALGIGFLLAGIILINI